MRIIVLIKPGAELEESDAYAVEYALRIARRRLDVQVSLLTSGPPTCVAALRAALALGADDAVHVLDTHTSPHDALALSRILAATLNDLGFDLVLSGAASDTPNLSALPAMVAARLDIPYLRHTPHVDSADTATTSTPVNNSTSNPTPTLISIPSHSTPPRYPPFPAIAEARQKLISTRTLPATIEQVPPDPVIIIRPLSPRSNTIIEASEDPHSAALQLVDFLAERRFI